MLGARLATAAVAIPALLLIILVAPPYALSLLILFLGCVALHEYLGMAFPSKPVERWLSLAAGAVVVLAAATSAAPGGLLAAALTACVAALLASVVFRSIDMDEGLRDASVALFGIVYVAILAHFVWLHRLDNGPYWVVFVVAVGMASDTGGYFAGKGLGRRKLLPRVSPGKTVEGAIGNLLAAAVAGVAARVVLFTDESWLTMVLLAVILAFVGQVGDLGESVIKRAFGVKESGSIFPGHGGVLDRIDSLLFPVAILYYYVSS